MGPKRGSKDNNSTARTVLRFVDRATPRQIVSLAVALAIVLPCAVVMWGMFSFAQGYWREILCWDKAFPSAPLPGQVREPCPKWAMTHANHGCYILAVNSSTGVPVLPADNDCGPDLRGPLDGRCWATLWAKEAPAAPRSATGHHLVRMSDEDEP